MALLRRDQHKNTIPLEVPRMVNHTTSIRLQHITMFLVTLLNKHKFITQWKCFQNIQVSNLLISLFFYYYLRVYVLAYHNRG